MTETLTIVIPALNEEQAIGDTIQRTLNAREQILRDGTVNEVEVIVVNDGSTDRTSEIAHGFDGITVLDFPKNRGYGAAIKAGFNTGTGSLVGFLDADGTCDPAFFADLCRAITNGGADVALGSRIGPQSRMPGVRRLGNRVYALILSALSNKHITDTASGMRVIRKSALEKLYPLPDGLHFTPAMSARVLMDDELSLAEVPMSYEERVGQSKLNVLRDGVRFLHTIFHMSLMWRPTRLFIGTAWLCFVVMVLLAMHPIESWIKLGRIEEGSIYRLLFCSWLGSVAATLLSIGVVADHLHRLVSGRTTARTYAMHVLDRLYSLRGAMLLSVVAGVICGWLVGEGLWTRITAGYVTVHWSRVVLAGLIAFTLIQVYGSLAVVNVLRFHAARRVTNGASNAASDKMTARTAPTAAPRPDRSAPVSQIRPALSV